MTPVALSFTSTNLILAPSFDKFPPLADDYVYK